MPDPFDLRRPAAPAAGPPQLAAATTLPGPGVIPHAGGFTRLTPTEDRMLTKLGVNPAAGDPVPGNIHELVTSFLDSEQQEYMARLANVPKAQITEVAFEQLAPEKQEAIRQLIAEFKARLQPVAASPAALDVPGLGAAMAAAAPAADPSVLVDGADLPAQVARMKARLTQQQHEDAALGAAPAPPAAANGTAPPAEPPPAAGAARQLTNCPYCNHLLAQPVPPPPSDEAKRQFLLFIAGGPTARYRSTYPFYDGQLKFTFRSLTYAESAMITRQVNYDVRDELLANPNFVREVDHMRLAFTTERIMRYRLALSLEAVQVADRLPELIPPIGECSWDPPAAGQPPQTPLPAFLEVVTSRYIRTESMYRLAQQAFFLFQQALDQMEARANDPGFLPVTGLPT